MNAILSRLGLADLLDLEAWHDARAPGLCFDVRQDFLTFVAGIEANPRLHASIPVPPRGREIRMGVTNRFPTLVVYEVLPTHLLVLTVVHAKSHPSRWRRRLRP